MARMVRLGLFVFVALLILFVAIFLIGERQFLFRDTYRLYALFDNVAGLHNGAEVRVGGIHQGTIDHIQLPRQSSGRVRVAMDMGVSSRHVIKKDSVASIQTEGLLGSKYVSVSFGSAEADPVTDRDTIGSQPPLDFSDLLQKGEEALNIASSALKHVDGAAENVEDITSKINRGHGAVGTLVNDRRVDQQLRLMIDNATQAVANFKSIGSRLDSGRGALGALISDKTMEERIRATLTNLSQTTEQMNAVTSRINRGEGALGALIRDEAAGRQIRDMLKNLAQASEDLKSIADKVDQGDGALGALVNDRSLAGELQTVLNEARVAVTAFNENMQALKRNWFFRGFFKDRGYWDSTRLSKFEIEKLPKQESLRKFIFYSRDLFDEPDNAKLENEGLLEQVGDFIEQNDFGLAVVAAYANPTGIREENLKLTQAQAMVVRRYLVDNFRIDDTQVWTKGMGEDLSAEPRKAGRLEIAIYPDDAQLLSQYQKHPSVKSEKSSQFEKMGESK